MKKTYEAFTPWVGGRKVDGDQVEWAMKILRGKKRAYEAEHGQEAVTRARLLGRVECGDVPLARWELMPLTGRSHQLRVALAKHYAPICGDELYGGKTVTALALPAAAIALRAMALDFSVIAEVERQGLPALFSVKGFLP